MINRYKTSCEPRFTGLLPRFLISTVASLIICLLTVACQQNTTPPCSDNLTSEDNPLQKNAGCLVSQNNSLLVIMAPNGKVSIPGGHFESGETAKCTAQRETYEETGLSVSPIKLAKVWSNDFHIYHCDIKNNMKTGTRDIIEVKKIVWLNNNEFDNYEWRFPNQKQWLRNWLKQTNEF